MEYIGLQADPEEVFAMMKKMSAKYKIMEEERSRQRKEKGDRKTDMNGTDLPREPGCPMGMVKYSLRGVTRECPK